MSNPTPEPITGNEDFAEVYSTATGLKQRVPRAWLNDPVLSRGLRPTPSQRELDGDLGKRPTQASKVPEIDKYATAAGIDFPTGADKDAKLTHLERVFAHSDEQTGLAAVEPDAPFVDPLDPALVAQGDPTDVPGSTVAASGDLDDTAGDDSTTPGDTVDPGEPTDPGGDEPPIDPPAAGDEEN